MNEKKRLVKNTLLIAIGNFGTKIITFLLLPLYTSLLSTSEYGTYDLIITINVLVIPLVTFSMHEALFRFIIDAKKDSKEFAKIVSNALIAVLFGILILFLIILVIALIFSDYRSLLLFLFLITASNSLFLFSNNLLRGMGKIKQYAIISCVKNIIQLLLNILVIVVFKLGINGLFISLFISDIIAFIVVITYSKLWKYMDIKLVNKKEIGPMLKYSMPLIPNALCAQIIHLSDRFVIIGFMGSSANGIYSISYKFPSIMETIYHYFYTAWGESASRVFSKGKEKAIEYYQSLHETINNFVFSSVIVLISFMPILFRFFIRGDYIDGFNYVPLLLLSMHFDCMAKFYSGIFTALKKTNVMATTTVIAATINILINVLLIKYIGLYAAAGSTLIAEFLLALLRRKKLKEYVQLHLSNNTIISMILVTIIVISLYSYNNIIMIFSSIIVSLLYFSLANKKVLIVVLSKMKEKFVKRKKSAIN